MTGRVLGLLHTAKTHRARFDRLLTELAPPEVAWVHCVREALLGRALDTIAVNTIAAGIETALATLQGQGAQQVLCTCSSIGGVAEQVGRQMALPTLRLDRPMAEAAVAAGCRILVAACLPSTLGPTAQLLNEAAHAQGRQLEIETLLIEKAWPLFEAGDEAGFARRIAGVILDAEPRFDAIVLAQASMEAAAGLLKQLPVPIFSSPRLGVAAALRGLTARPVESAMSPARLQQGRMA